MNNDIRFRNGYTHVLADCVQNSDNQYVVRETLFEDLEALAKHLSDGKYTSETHSFDGQAISSQRALFISGTHEIVSKFLQSIGIAGHIASRYCRVTEDPWEDDARVFSSEEYSFFFAKWGATRSTRSKHMCPWVPDPSAVDAVSMALEHIRCNGLPEGRFKRNRDTLLPRRRSQNRRVASLQAISIVSTPGFPVIWAEPLTLMGRTTRMTNSTPHCILEEVFDKIRAHTYEASMTMCNKIVTELHRLIVSHELETLRHMQLAFDDIHAEMTDNDMLYDEIGEWRRLMGFWKPYLHSRERFAEQYGEVLRSRCASKNATLPSDGDAQEIRNNLDAFVMTLGKTISHCDSTFNSCIGTYNGIESQKAIYEAEQITKLTQLAFLFIPLTFVTGFFGMNLKELSPDPPSLWVWAVTATAVLTASYIMLYRHAIANLARCPLAKWRVYQFGKPYRESRWRWFSRTR